MKEDYKNKEVNESPRIFNKQRGGQEIKLYYKKKNPEQYEQYSAIKVNDPNKLKRYILLARAIRDS
jgi:hypothetical protein